MKEIIIRFLDVATIKFIGTEKLIELVKKYYTGLEDVNAIPNYTIKLNEHILPHNIKIPKDTEIKKCFAGPCYYSWKEGNYDLAYSPPEERGGSHLVIRKGRNIQVSFHDEEPIDQIIGISREILTREALYKGYMPIHASVISKDNKGYIFFGEKNKGKSTSLFSSVIFDGAKPMSSDVAMVREEDTGWKVMGWPWTVTIDKSYFNIITREPRYNIINNAKVKYYPSDFCKEFDTQWIWKQPLEKLISVELNPNSQGSIRQISSDELKQQLEMHGKENWWKWDDVFGLGDKKPTYEYERLSNMINGEKLTGDIINFWKYRTELER